MDGETAHSSSSHKLLSSRKISDQINKHLNRGRVLVPIGKPVERRLRPENPSNFISQAGSVSTRSVEQPSLVTQNSAQSSSSDQGPLFARPLDGQHILPTQKQYLTCSHQNQYLPTNQNSFEQNLPKESTDINNYDHPTNTRIIRLSIPSTEQYLTNPNQQDSRQQPQRRKIRARISIKPKSNSQMPTLQGVTKKSLSSILSNLLNSLRREMSTYPTNYLPNKQKLQAKRSAKSAEHTHSVITTNLQNIAVSATNVKQNSEIPSCSFYQRPIIQHSTAHEKLNQSPCTENQLVNQYISTNSKLKRVHLKDDITNSAVNESHLNVMDNAYQIDESNSNDVTDHEEILDHDMSTDEDPFETKNDVNSSGITGSRFVDRQMAAENSSSLNHQTHARSVLKQQISDNFATGLVGNSASNSTNLPPEDPQAIEERHTADIAITRSSNENQNRYSVASKKLKKKLWRFVLPPEYDPHDTRWTLKYRNRLPGLVELMPRSGIYVSQGVLAYCQHVSRNCESLARRLLKEVFNRRALSVCLSMSENAQDSNNVGSNVRPKLNEHASTVLLNFVIEHGLRCGWNTDLKPILSNIDTKIKDIRFKYGLMAKC